MESVPPDIDSVFCVIHFNLTLFSKKAKGPKTLSDFISNETLRIILFFC
jgi:hypothetical protein